MTARPTSRTRALTYANVTATLALAVALGGGGAAVAAGVAKNSVGSAQIKTGAVKTSDLAAGAVTSKKVKDGTLTGADLADGSVAGGDVKDGSLTGADVVESTLDLSSTRAGNVFAAVVNPDGTLVPGQSNGASSSVRTGTGFYSVTFNSDVSDCAYAASIGQSGDAGIPPAGDAGAVGLNKQPTGVFVSTHNQAGASANQPFHLLVVC